MTTTLRRWRTVGAVRLQGQIETTLTGVTLTTGASAELIINTARVVSLGAEHVQSTELTNLVAFFVADGLEHRERGLVSRVELFGIGREAPTLCFATSESFVVATEHDVDATSGHVGSHRDGVLASGLRHDLGLAKVLLRVQDLVGDAGLREFAREELGLLHRRGTEQHGLALVTAFAHVVDDRGEFRGLGLEDQVRLVHTNEWLVRGDRHDRKFVGVTELRRFGLRRTGHAGQLLVEAEVVLQRDGRPGVILLLDPHPLFGFDRWCSPSDQRRPSRVRPVNSSTIFTSPASTR